MFLCATIVGAQESAIDDSVVESEVDETLTQSEEPLLTADALEEARKKEELAKEALEKAEQKRQEEASKAKPPKEVFKPTEEISEDLPVPFPVDI